MPQARLNRAPRRRFASLTAGLAALVLTTTLAPTAEGAIIELYKSSQQRTLTNGIGNARGIRFTANQSFSITSVGIFANLKDELFDVVIYDFTPDPTPNDNVNDEELIPVASALNKTPVEEAVADGTWNDIPISYTFAEDEEYVVLWRRSNPPGQDTTMTSDGELLVWDLGSLSTSDDLILPELTATSGRAGDNGEFGNAYAPRLRLNAIIPEPGTLALLAVGAGVALLPRRRGAA